MRPGDVPFNIERTLVHHSIHAPILRSDCFRRNYYGAIRGGPNPPRGRSSLQEGGVHSISADSRPTPSAIGRGCHLRPGTHDASALLTLSSLASSRARPFSVWRADVERSRNPAARVQSSAEQFPPAAVCRVDTRHESNSARRAASNASASGRCRSGWARLR
jgi:hypothetical protein